MKSTLGWILLLVSLAGIVGLGYLFFIGIRELSTLIPVPLSIGIIIAGVFCFFFSKYLLGKKSVYRRDNFEEIILDTPLSVDILYISGIFLFSFGLLTFRYVVEFLSGDTVFLVVLIFFVFVYLFLIAIRLRFALNDKIIISKRKFRYDDPYTKGSTEIIKDKILRFIFMKTFTYSSKGHSSSFYNYQLQLITKGNEPGKEENRQLIHIEEMHLNVPAVVMALEEMGYEVVRRAWKENTDEEWDGHKFQ